MHAISFGMSDMMVRLRPESAHPTESMRVSEPGFESLVALRIVPELRAPSVAEGPRAGEEAAEEDDNSELSDCADVGGRALLDGAAHDDLPLLSPSKLDRRAATESDSSTFGQLDSVNRQPAQEFEIGSGAGSVAASTASMPKMLDHRVPSRSPEPSPPTPYGPRLDAGDHHYSFPSVRRGALLPDSGATAAREGATGSSARTIGEPSLEGDMRDVARSAAGGGSESVITSAGWEDGTDTRNSAVARQSRLGQRLGPLTGKAFISLQASERSLNDSREEGLVPAPARGVGGLSEFVSDVSSSSDVLGREEAANSPALSERSAAPKAGLSHDSEVVRTGSKLDGDVRALSSTPADTGEGPLSEGLSRFLPLAVPVVPVKEFAPQELRPPQSAAAPAPHLQLADGIVAARDGAVEITLNPHELGRVKVMITGDHADLQIGIIVERADTLDLLRRHADLLLRELKDNGIDHAQLDFARQHSGERDRDRDRAGGQSGVEDGGSVSEPDDRTRASRTASENAHDPAEAGRIEAGRRLDVRM